MLALLFLACGSQEILDSGLDDFDTEIRAAIEADIASIGATAFSMAVIREGEVVWSDGFGTHTKSGVPVTADTLFRVASLTKPMTAISVLQQVDDGCLDLDAPVDAYIEDFVMKKQPEMASELLVRDTLNMSGGLADYQLVGDDEGNRKLEEFVAYTLQVGFFLSPPGRMYNYSNTNFAVAGRLVEVCSGTNFRSMVKDTVWDPLGMVNSAFSTKDVVANGDYAIGVTTGWPEQLGEEVELDAESFSTSHLWPAMGAWSSANDLAMLGMFLMEGDADVLSTDLHSAMTSLQIDTEEGYSSKGYGYGLNVKTGIKMGDAVYPVTMLSHTGQIYGNSAHLYLIPELEIGVVALINRELAMPVQSVEAALDLASLSQGEAITTEIPDEFSDYVGSYFNEFIYGSFILTSDEAGLLIEIPSLDQDGIGYEERLEPVRPDNFVIHYPNGTADPLSFIRDEAGDVEYIRHRIYVGERVDGSAIQAAGAPVDPSVWRSAMDVSISVFD